MTIDELRAMEKAATAGEWYSTSGYVSNRSPEGRSFQRDIRHIDELGRALNGGSYQAVVFDKVEDAEFIATARNVMPLLLDIAEAAKNLGFSDGKCFGHKEVNAALDRLEKLKK